MNTHSRLVWVLDPTQRLAERVCHSLDQTLIGRRYELFDSLQEMQRGFEHSTPDLLIVCTSGYSSSAAAALRVHSENHPGLALIVVDEGATDNSTRNFVVTGAQDVVPLKSLTPNLMQHVMSLAIVRAETEVAEARISAPDPLTNLANRETMDRRLNRALQHTAVTTTARSVGVIFLDLDQFKMINDTYGHAAGDHVLKVVSQRLLSVVRPEDVVGRQGGDEFLIVLEGHGLELVVESVAERCRETVSHPIDWKGHSLQLSASVGVVLDGPAVTSEEMIDRADRAQYFAKHQGGDCVVVFDDDMADWLAAEDTLYAEVDRACRDGSLGLQTSRMINLTGSPNDLKVFTIPEGVCANPKTLLSHINQLVAELSALRGSARTGFVWSATDLEACQVVRDIAERFHAAGVETLVGNVDPRKLPVELLEEVSASALVIDYSHFGDLTKDRGSDRLLKAVAGFAVGLGLEVVVTGLETAEEIKAVQACGVSSAVVEQTALPAPTALPV